MALLAGGTLDVVPSIRTMVFDLARGDAVGPMRRLRVTDRGRYSRVCMGEHG